MKSLRAVLIVLAVVVFGVGCNAITDLIGGGGGGGGGSNDITPPSDVTNGEVAAGNTRATVSWTDPTDTDLDHIRLEWGSGSTTVTEVALGTETVSLTGLTNGSLYSFLVKAVDTSGNASSGVSLSETPVALDAVVGNLHSDNNRLYVGESSGGFTTSSVPSPQARITRSVVAGDFSGNGLTHFFMTNAGSSPEQNRMLINTGSGSFSAADTSEAAARNSYAAATGDFDEDGDLDVFVANDGQNRVYIGDGDGTFSPSDVVDDAGGSRTSYGVGVGYFDGDDHLDAFVANFGEENQLYLGNGSGGFTVSDASADTFDSNAVCVGDFNEDEHSDVFVANEAQRDRVYLGDGAGGFTVSDASTRTDNSKGLAVADLNADGHLDVFVAAGGTDANVVYLGNGSGGYTASTPAPLEGRTSYAVALGDIDGDGILDAFVANLLQENRVYTGDGSGGFTVSLASSDNNSSYGVALADFDGQ